MPYTNHTFKGIYYGNPIDRSAHSDAAWRNPHLATQPELGLWPERWTGLDSDYSDYSAIIGQNLSGMNGL